jgi:hypothetical protein
VPVTTRQQGHARPCGQRRHYAGRCPSAPGWPAQDPARSRSIMRRAW